jgi:hypothetical protein
MPVTDSGKLEKMIIKSFRDVDFTREDGEFSVMFNPDSYTVNYEVDSDVSQAFGTSAAAPSFSRLKPQEMTIDILIDGTGVTTGEPVDVQDQVDAFLRNTYEYQGDEHKPRYLKVLWGTLVLKCVLKSASIKYTLFKPGGTPLRAVITAAFLGSLSDEYRAAREDSSSPDITHQRTVTRGDSLPLMSYRIYGDPKYYLQIAAHNEITNFRNIKPGEQILFPPVRES